MNRIKEIREQQELLLIDLARKSGLSTGYLTHLEKGTRTNPSLKTMSKIAKALNKEIGDVFKLD